MLNKFEAIVDDPLFYMLSLALVCLFAFAFGLAIGFMWALAL